MEQYAGLEQRRGRSRTRGEVPLVDERGRSMVRRSSDAVVDDREEHDCSSTIRGFAADRDRARSRARSRRARSSKRRDRVGEV